ncbi:MAG: signal peptidase II [Clostridia bacterium]|nr:signal peptidase II [Clostridia bacterium]
MRSIAIVSVIAFLLDRISKIIMVNNVFKIESLTADSYAPSVTVIDKVLDFSYVGNEGVAFGMLQHNKLLLILLCIVILAVIGYIIYKTKPESMLEKVSYGMIIGGAIGNVYDRIAHGFVIDFIDVKFIDYPTFNIADCFVVVGAVMLCIFVLFFDKKEDEVGKI